MFEFIYKGLARGIWKELEPKLQTEVSTLKIEINKELEGLLTSEKLGDLVEKTLNDEEVQKLIIGFTDALFERYKQKVTGSIGGALKGSLTDDSIQGLPIPPKYAKLLKNPFVKMFLGGMGSGEAQKSGGLP